MIMKRAIIFILYLSVVYLSAVEVGDDAMARLAEALSMSTIDVQTCMNKTNIKIEDLMNMDELVEDNLNTPDIESSALKVGCLFACVLQKKEVMSGPHINIEKLKELLNTKVHPNNNFITIRNQILDTCSERVKSKTDECEVTMKFLLCTIAEATRYRGF